MTLIYTAHPDKFNYYYYYFSIAIRNLVSKTRDQNPSMELDNVPLKELLTMQKIICEEIQLIDGHDSNS